MKRIKLVLLLLVTLSLGLLAACGEDVSPQDILDEAFDLVEIDFTGTDSLTNVTQDITLPTEEGDVAITWTTSDLTVISATGDVTRGPVDVSVVVTATLTYKDVTTTKQFTLVVKGDQAIADQLAVAAAKNQLAITYATGDTATAVTKNITLPATVAGVNVTWSSNNTAYITNAGVVYRGTASQAVTMTATLTKGATTDTKTFNLTVLFDQNLVDAAAVAAAKDALAITFSGDQTASTVTSNVTLPNAIGDVNVSWATNNAAAITNAGVVTQTSANQSVTLTATLTLGDQTETKVFNLTVLLSQTLLDQELVDEAKAALAITFTGDDVASAVTSNVTLPTTLGDVTISWSSSLVGAISNSGVVVRTLTNQNVTLTATLTKGTATETKVFNLVVTADQTLIDAALNASKLALETLYEDTLGDDEFEVVENLVLVTEINGYPVSWHSSDTALVATNGTVVRPAWTIDGGATATLTATITVSGQTVEVTYFAFVKSLDKTLAQTLEEALLIVSAFPVVEGITANQTFPATTTYQEVTYNVTWESDKPQFLSNTGVITRPAIGQPNELVTVIVSITVEETTVSRTLTFNVIAFESAEETLNIADAITVPDGTYIMIPGVTLFAKTGAGLYFADATGIIYVYDTVVIYPFVTVGHTYDISGEFDVYFSSPQLRGDNVLKPFMFAESDAEPVIPPYTPDVTVSETINQLVRPTNNSLVQLFYSIYEVTGKIIIDAKDTQSGTNYNTWIVDATYEGTEIIQTVDGGTAKAYFAPTINIYYQTNKAAFQDLNGEIVTIKLMILGYRTDRLVWYAGFLGTAADIDVQIQDDAEAVAYAKSQLPSFFASGYDVETTIDLPSSIGGATITYETTSPYFNVETGLATMPVDSQQTVTLTATITRGTVTDTRVITFTVGEYPIIDIADALLLPTTTIVRVVGVVTGQITNRTFAIQDETGAIAIFIPSADLATWLARVGKTVEIIGSRSAFSGLQQITPSVIVDGATNPIAPTNIDHLSFTQVALTPYIAQFVTRTGLEIVSVTRLTANFDNYNIVVKDSVTNEEMLIFWDSRVGVKADVMAYLDAFVVGDTVKLENIAVSINNGVVRFEFANMTQLVKVSFVPETDEEKVVQAALDLTLPEEINTNQTIVLPTAGNYGTTIAWASSHPSIISTEGVVTVSDTPTVVTLTATVTLNDETETREFMILVEEVILTIAEVRAATVGQLIITEGLITDFSVASNGTSILLFMQDETAGIYVFGVPIAEASKIAVGNIIRVYGTRAYWSTGEVIQIGTITKVTVISEENLVEPLLIDTAAELALVQGQYVEVSGYLRQLTIGSSGTDLFLVNEFGQIQVRLGYSDVPVAVKDAINAKLSVALGTYITIVGGASRFRATMQVMLFNEDSITIGDMGTDQQLAEAALSVLVMPEENAELISNITLPITPLYFGATIEWTSSNPAVISNTGVVTRPESGQPNAEVAVSYVLTLNAVTLEGTINFTVLAEEPIAEEAVLTHNFNLAELANNTTYVTTPTESEFTNIVDSVKSVFTRFAANISARTSGEINNKGVVLAIRSSTSYQAAYFKTNFAVNGLAKIDFKFSIWNTDYSFNAAAMENLLVQTSTDGIEWVTEYDVKPIITTAADATFNVSVDLASVGNYYVRIIMNPSATASTVLGTQYSMRVILQELKLYS